MLKKRICTTRKLLLWIGLGMVYSVSFYNCNPNHLYPVEPYLEFVSLTQTQISRLGDELLLKLSFTDGDGDIGQSNSTEENLKIYLHLKDNGEWKIMDTLPSFGTSLDPLISSGEESISGYIEQKIYVQGLRDLQICSDTIRFECWLIDRKKHESNHVITPEYVIIKR